MSFISQLDEVFCGLYLTDEVLESRINPDAAVTIGSFEALVWGHYSDTYDSNKGQSLKLTQSLLIRGQWWGLRLFES